MKPPKQRLRMRATVNKATALAHYEEMRAAGKADRAIVVVEQGDHIQVLGQGCSLSDIGELLLFAAEGLKRAEQDKNRMVAEPHQPTTSDSPVTGGTRPARAITKEADGTLVAPKGEHIISCGECKHPRWYVLLADHDEMPSRFACAHCGNEIMWHRIRHEGGRA